MVKLKKMEDEILTIECEYLYKLALVCSVCLPRFAYISSSFCAKSNRAFSGDRRSSAISQLLRCLHGWILFHFTSLVQNTAMEELSSRRIFRH
ncbi:hypothetical protein L1887_16816 [Cichorium endivia]|nr:hypothetical protein L1887_16816 [Cichorium endivia]